MDIKSQLIRYIFLVLIIFLLTGCSRKYEQPQSCEQQKPLCKENVVKIHAITITNNDNVFRSQGSGFFIRYKNRPFFVTATHVVKRTTGICLFTKENDVVVIDNYKPMHIGDSDITIYKLAVLPNQISTLKLRLSKIQKEETITAIGFSRTNMGIDILFRKGLFLNDYSVALNGSKYIGTTCVVQAGMSGGPVVDKNGKVVGVISSKFKFLGIDRSFAASAKTIQTYLDLFF